MSTRDEPIDAVAHTEVSDYVAGLAEPQRTTIAALYATARTLVPEAVEGMSYAMPALIYRGKGLLAVMNTKKHIGIYPFGSLGELAAEVEAAGLGSTKGSIHLREGQQLPDGLRERFVLRRKAQIDAKA